MSDITLQMTLSHAGMKRAVPFDMVQCKSSVDLSVVSDYMLHPHTLAKLILFHHFLISK